MSFTHCCISRTRKIPGIYWLLNQYLLNTYTSPLSPLYTLLSYWLNLHIRLVGEKSMWVSSKIPPKNYSGNCHSLTKLAGRL